MIATSDPRLGRKVPSDAVAVALVDPVVPSSTPSGIKNEVLKGIIALPQAAYALEPDEVAQHGELITKIPPVPNRWTSTLESLMALMEPAWSISWAVDQEIAQLCDEPELQLPGRRYIQINNAIVDAESACLDGRGVSTASARTRAPGCELSSWTFSDSDFALKRELSRRRSTSGSALDRTSHP